MRELSDGLAKRFFLISIAIIVLGAVFIFGALAYRYEIPPIPQLTTAKKVLSGEIIYFSDPRQTHLQPSRGQGSGVMVNKGPDDGALVLLAGFFDEENQIRLISRDGRLKKKWSLDYFKNFPVHATRVCDLVSPLHTDVHGAHLNRRGEVVFNYEYCGSVKLDQCGKLVWSISMGTHHSLVPAETGGYWLMGRYNWLSMDHPDRFPPFSTPATSDNIIEDTILRVGESGEVVYEVSIPVLMRENGLEAILTATGSKFENKTVQRGELVHANKVAELPSGIADFYPLFSSGDLAISMRNLNLIMVVDPVTKRVKWHQTGPWLRQHDPEFRPDGRISIFNNNVYETAYVDDQTVLSTPFTTNIIAVDPVSRETEVLFGEMPGQEMLSVIRGQHELVEGGGMLITEFDAGRVFQVDENGEITWEFVNRYDDDFVGEITNAAIYPPGYFQAEWRACDQ